MADTDVVEALPWQIRSDWIASHLMSIWGEAADATRADAFQIDDDHHLTWLPTVLDLTGWREALAVLDDALCRLMEVHKQAAERVAKSDQQGHTATFAMLGFGTHHARLAS